MAAWGNTHCVCVWVCVCVVDVNQQVAALRKAAFERQLREQHQARRVTRQNAEAALFRQMFVEAVEREKELLLMEQRR